MKAILLSGEMSTTIRSDRQRGNSEEANEKLYFENPGQID
jgi:hypothetical protein